MKIIILHIFLFIIPLNVFSQEKKDFSIEIATDSYYYFMGSQNKNNFNYGFSVTGAKYINKLKIKSGFNFSTKNFKNSSDTFFSVLNREYIISYFSIPVFVDYRLLKYKSLKSYLSIGISFNKIINYKINSFYKNGKIVNENYLKENKKIETSIFFSLIFLKPISKKINIDIAPFTSLKLSQSKSSKPNYKNLPNDRILLGIKIGIELCFD